MRAAIQENLAEAAIGALVLAVAGWFLLFAYERTQGGVASGGYEVVARFPNASGVGIGTDVRISGLKVGTVTAQSLDPNTYEALLTMALDPKVKLPADSSAAITSEGILGGNYVSLRPGAEADMLRPGDEIIDTSGAVDLLGLIGSVVNQTAGAGAPDSAAPEAPSQ